MRRLFVLTAAMAMVITSCKKYEVSQPIDLETLPTVTIKGNVYATLDETKPSGTYDLVPKSKLMVRVSIPYSNYDANNTSGGYYVKEADITGDGAYEVKVPYVSKGVTATISFMDFTYDVKVRNDYGDTRTVLKHFVRTDRTISGLGSGRSEDAYDNINAIYNAGTSSPVDSATLVSTHKVKVSGKLEYHAADTGTAPGDAQYKRVLDTKITATIVLTAPDGRKYKDILIINVQNGNYQIDVPMVARGTATVELSGEGYWEFTDIDNKRSVWRHTLSVTPPFTVYDYRDGTQEGKDYQYTKGEKMYDVQ